MANAVGQHDEVFLCIQQTAGREQYISELGLEELVPIVTGSVQDHHGVGNTAGAVAHGLAQDRIVQAQRGQRLSGFEFEIPDDEIAFLRGWIGGMRVIAKSGKGSKKYEAG
jgi:hypothetical protein